MNQLLNISWKSPSLFDYFTEDMSAKLKAHTEWCDDDKHEVVSALKVHGMASPIGA